MSQHAAPQADPSWATWLSAWRLLVPAATTPTGRGRRATHRHHRSMPPGPALVLVTAFVCGGVAGVTVDQTNRDARLSAQVAADTALAAHYEQVATAADERLSGQATAFLASRRTEALSAAQDAMAEVGLLTASVTPVVDTDTLAPLDEAMTALADLVGAAPNAPTVLDTAVATVAAEQPAATLPTATELSPTTPGSDVLALAATVESAAPDISRPVESPGATARGTGTGDDVASATAGQAAAPTTPTPEPGSAISERVSATDEARRSSRGTDRASTASATGTSGPSVVPATPSIDDIFVRGTSIDAPPTIQAAAVAALAAGDLDVATSNRILTLVDEIRELTSKVQQEADAVVAARDAQARAEAAAQEAAERAMRTLSTRIAAVRNAPNGEIPESLLCGVAYATDVLLRCDAAAMLEKMDAAYRQDTGRHLGIVSSYRNNVEQDALRASRGTLAAAAGTSNHGRALAIDVAGAGSLGQFSAPTYLWLRANAATYGWHHPSYMEPGGSGPLEPWHWEYDTL